MRRVFSLGVGESFVVEHPCGLKHTVINIEGIQEVAGEVEMLLQTWQDSTLLESQRVTLAKSQLGALAGLLVPKNMEEDEEAEPELSSGSGFQWRR
jgi:hypothetical protein